MHVELCLTHYILFCRLHATVQRVHVHLLHVSQNKVSAGYK